MGELKVRMTNFETELERMSNVLIDLARVDGRLNRLEDLIKLQGQRLDDSIRRFEAFMDRMSDRA